MRVRNNKLFLGEIRADELIKKYGIKALLATAKKFQDLEFIDFGEGWRSFEDLIK